MRRQKFIFTLVCALLLTAVIVLLTSCWVSLDIPPIMTICGGIFLTVLVAVVWVCTVIHVRRSVRADKNDADKH